MQYRGEILPLVRLTRRLGGAGTRADGDVLAVVVCSLRGRAVGLVVDAVADIVEGGLPGRGDLDGPGLLGAAVVQDRITELLDVEQAVRSADPAFYDASAVPAKGRT